MTLRRRRWIGVLTLVGLGVATQVGSTAAQAKGSDAVYRVTITNLTSGQPFSPPYLATGPKDAVFDVGRPASSGVQEMAENGDTALTLRHALEQAQARGDIDAWAGGVPPATKPQAPAGTPGASGTATNNSGTATNNSGSPAGPCSTLNFPCPAEQTITVRSSGADSRLSLVAMLVCTNDGFVGLAGAKLPNKVGDTLSYDATAFDAGTETDTQRFEDIMPWCQSIVGTYDPAPVPFMGSPFAPLSGQVTTSSALVEGGVVRPHAGVVTGVGELSAVHRWTGPVARVVVTRTS